MTRSPFDLEIRSYVDIDRHNFYTMSSQGVTHMLDGEAEFYTLEDFEKEFFLFQVRWWDGCKDFG